MAKYRKKKISRYFHGLHPISLLLSRADKHDVQERTPDVLRCIHIDVLRWNDLRKHLLLILSHVCITDVFSWYLFLLLFSR